MKAGSGPHNDLCMWPPVDELSMLTQSVNNNFKLPNDMLSISKRVDFNLCSCVTSLNCVACHNHDRVAANVVGELGQVANPELYLHESISYTDYNVKHSQVAAGDPDIDDVCVPSVVTGMSTPQGASSEQVASSKARRADIATVVDCSCPPLNCVCNCVNSHWPPPHGELSSIPFFCHMGLH